MAAYVFARCSRPQSAQWAHIASAPLPSTQALSRKDVERTNETTKEKLTVPYPPSADAMKEGMGRDSGVSPVAPSSAAPSASSMNSRCWNIWINRDEDSELID